MFPAKIINSTKEKDVLVDPSGYTYNFSKVSKENYIFYCTERRKESTCKAKAVVSGKIVTI